MMYPRYTCAEPSTIRKIEDYLQIPWLPNAEVKEPGIIFVIHPGWNFRNHYQSSLNESFEKWKSYAIKKMDIWKTLDVFRMAREYHEFNWLIDHEFHKIVGISWMLGDKMYKDGLYYDNRHVEIVKRLLAGRSNSTSFVLTPHKMGDLYLAGVPGTLIEEKKTLEEFIKDFPMAELGARQYDGINNLSKRFKNANLVGGEVRACLSHALSSLYYLFNMICFNPDLSYGEIKLDDSDYKEVFEKLKTLNMVELAQDQLMKDIFRETSNPYVLMRDILTNNPYPPIEKYYLESAEWIEKVQRKVRIIPLEEFPVLG